MGVGLRIARPVCGGADLIPAQRAVYLGGYPYFLADTNSVIGLDWVNGNYWNEAVCGLDLVQEETRPGPAYVLDGSGNYVLRAANEPAYAQGHGLDGFGQYTNDVTDPEDLTTGNWTPNNVTVSANGTFGPIGLTQVETDSDGNAYLLQGQTAVIGQAYFFGWLYDPVTSGNDQVQVRVTDPSAKRAFYYPDTDTVTNDNADDAGKIDLDGDRRLLWIKFTASTTTPSVGVYPSNVGGDIINAGAVFLIQSDILPPYDPATRYADNSGSVKALRSDGMTYQPCAGWEAAGYDNGFTAILNFYVPYLSANADRTIFAVGTDEDNCDRVDITTANVLKFIRRVSGTDTFTKTIATLDQTGWYGLAARIKTGDYRFDLIEPDATVLTPVTDTDSNAAPAYTKIKFARGFATGSNMNSSPALGYIELAPIVSNAQQAAYALKAFNEAPV